MIHELNSNSYCIEDISLIENYDKAISDTSQTWYCHHRKETDNGLSREQLKKLNLYYHRPASELIYLTNSEHKKLHNSYKHNWRGKHSWNYNKNDWLTEEHKQNIINSNKNRVLSEETIDKKRNSMLGKNKGQKRTEEVKQKIKESLSRPEIKQKMSEAHKGKHLSDETKQKLRDINLGKYHSDETKQKMSEAHKGKQFSDETKQKLSKAQLKRFENKENHPNFGKHHSDETKQKLSLSIKKIWEIRKNV